MKSLPAAPTAAVVDLVLVVLFVLFGRTSHGEQLSPGGFFTTLWPFLVGLAAGWAVSRAWRRPMSVGHTGLVVWVVTVVVGLLLRVVTGQGAPFAFVVVASIVLGAFLVGWRVLLVALERRSTRPSYRSDRRR